MRFSVSASKITPPHLPNVLYRPRLLNLLEKNQDKKLILILGQAAQGKTTLAASYVMKSRIPFAWMNLDREDSDPINLFYLIVHSIQEVLREIDYSDLLSYPMETIGVRSEIPLFREWTQSIRELISGPVYMVMDGLDQLSQEGGVFKFLQVLLDETPPDLHMIMLSRETPPDALVFQHLKIRQQAMVLTNEELAFNRDEIKEFFQKNRKIFLNPDQLTRISQATEGWVGGLILLAESLSRYPDASMEKSISEDLPDHYKKEVFQYFGKEIFSFQPKQVQEFLIKSSIANLVEPGFMKDFTGMDNAEEILRDHSRRNLFVHAFYDEEKGWLFRYHQSFRGFLKAKFKSEIGEEERRSLFLRAGTLYEQKNDLENAVKCFLEAKAFPQAASVIERLGIDLLRVGRKSDLLQWLHALPEDAVEGHPWLLLYLAMTRRFMAGKENAVALEKAYSLFKQQGDRRGSLIALAFLIEVSVHTGIHLIPIGRLLDEGEALLQSAESDPFEYERALLWHCMGLGYMFGGGDIPKGISACQNAYVLSTQTGDISLQAYSLNFSTFGNVFLGEFSLADDTCKKVEKIIEKSVYPEFKAAQLMVQCLLANHRGDLSKAQELVEKLQNEIEKHGLVNIHPWTYEISGYLEVMGGKFSEAERIGQQYLSTAISLRNGMFKGLALRLLGLVYLHWNDFDKAREVLDQCMNVFSNETPSTYQLNRARIKMGLVCTHLQEYERAEKELGAALQYFSSISSYISMVEAHFSIAFLCQAQGKKEDAVSYLRAGFRIAADRKYEYLYTLGIKYLTKACLLALELNVEGANDYALHLFSIRPSPQAEEGIERVSNHLSGKVREKVREIRRQIHRSRIPCLSIKTLGGFQVIRGDHVIKEDEWDRSQPKQLLKVIVSCGAKGIPKETLIDQLWPEERPKAAESDFKTTLQRLRKSLEPDINKDFGSSYVHLQDNVVSIDPELCQIDVNLFLFLVKKGEEMEKTGNLKEALTIYNEAIQIYKGDFLPNESYLPRADERREELREKYIELLGKAAHLNDRQGSVKKAIECYKKAIGADSLLEESYQKLMTLYSSKGMYNEALRTYEACKKVLKEELKTKPDPMTTALYNKILEKIQSS